MIHLYSRWILFLFVVKDWGVGYLTELRGVPKKGVASGVIFSNGGTERRFKKYENNRLR